MPCLVGSEMCIRDRYNEDEIFQRVKIRKFLEKLKLNGLDQKKFSITLNNLRHSNEVVRFYVKENLKKNTYLNHQKNQLFLNDNFFNQPYEVVFRSLSDSLRLIGKKYYSVRGKKLAKIIDGIINNNLYKATLGGCIVKKVNQTVIIIKEC